MTVFVCGEEPEDIWCAIYDAWMSRLGHRNVRIEPAGQNRELFCDYREVHTSGEKAEKVTDSIRRKLSEAVYEEVFKAALSRDPFRADKIYRFLIYGFAIGPKAADMLQIPAVFELFQITRRLEREYGHLREFVRFSQMKEGILLGRIAPENDLVVLLAPHFSDRMPSENWILYDAPRKKAAVHQADRGWVLMRTVSEAWQQRLERETDEAVFENLWRTFHTSIAIEQRRNPRCQQNLLPLRFRPYMTEFQQEQSGR